MFDGLGHKIHTWMQQWRGRGVLTPEEVATSLRQLRIILIEADVALPAIQHLLSQVQERLSDTNKSQHVAAHHLIVHALHQSLCELLAHNSIPWRLSKKPPHVILLVGLQGSGKTTMAAKLAWMFSKGQWGDPVTKTVAMASTDIYRPAAQHQLEVLGQSLGIPTLDIQEGEKPLAIATRALAHYAHTDVLIIDTAGRLHINQDMMDELIHIKQAIQPHDTILVMDALTGQDGLQTAQAFQQALGLTGCALSRVDGDSRAGVALSLRYATNCPIKVMGLGERPDQIMRFDPKRLADRILDQGDIVGLVEQTQHLVINEQEEKSRKRLEKGIFTLEDLVLSMDKMQSMGGLMSVLSFIPGMRGVKEALKDTSTTTDLKKIKAIISSMTVKERRRPALLNASRKKRIAMGSGTDVAGVNRLLTRWEGMQKMMKMLQGSPPRR